MPRLLPIEQNTDVVTYAIEVNGETLPLLIAIYAIEVFNEVNRIPTACIYLADGDASRGGWPVSSGDYFIPGNEIKISAGYHSENTEIFSGIVINQTLKVRQRRLELMITCKSKEIAMTTTKKSRHFPDSTDSDVISAILDEYEITPDIASTDVTHEDLVSYDCTDWDFIMMRMEANGLVCRSDEKGLHAFAPNTDEAPAATLQFGANIIEFDGDIDARSQAGNIIARAWDPVNQDIAESAAEDPAWTTTGNLDAAELASAVGADERILRHAGTLSTDELQAWTNSALLRSRMAFLRGRAKVQGLAVALPGAVVEIAGMGDRINGNAWIGSVRHEISHGNWLSDIEFGVPETSHAGRFMHSDTSAAMLVKSIQGLHTGVVTTLEDPTGEGRIRVRVPSIDFEGEGIWARVATLDAGDGRGTFFLPEVDDEVIIGFVNNDPRKPVVLGMVHSSAKPPPEEASDDNHVKAYYSRTGMRVVFDDENTILTLDTPGGHSLILDDDAGEISLIDSNNNAIKLSSSGITIESAGDLILKGSANVNVEGGTNVELKASAQWKAEGSAGVELNSSAVTVVKGSLVQIN